MGFPNLFGLCSRLNLRLSSLRAATATRGLTDHGITHILSVCSEPIPAEVPQSGIRHRRIEVQDVDYADLLIKLPYAVEFIYHALSTGGTILVHCDTGNSRSAAVVAAYRTRLTVHTGSCDSLNRSSHVLSKNELHRRFGANPSRLVSTSMLIVSF